MTDTDKGVTADELRRCTAFLADCAGSFAAQAGVGGMETAGGFVSFLATNPEKAADFLDAPLRALPPDFWRHGCLSWHGANGQIFSPKHLREMEGNHAH